MVEYGIIAHGGVGSGATAFARKLGFSPFHGVSPQALADFKKTRELIRKGDVEKMNPRWKGVNQANASADTVGAAAIHKKGFLPGATSTEGASPMMVGRVGDKPLFGCGCYDGSTGAVTVTGLGEEIVEPMVAKYAYDLVQEGRNVKTACEAAVLLFPPHTPVGVIAISRKDCGIAVHRSMAVYVLTKGR